MTEESKYKQLARKLYLLTLQGIGGEKYNAQRQLDRVLKQYGITKEELEEDDRSKVVFKVPRALRKLFIQVGLSVVGNTRYFGSSKKQKTLLVIEVSKAEEAEIRAKFNFFSRAFRDEQDLFFTAFIYKNQLLPTDGGTSDKEELSPAEKARLYRIAKIMESLKKSDYMHQLKTGS